MYDKNDMYEALSRLLRREDTEALLENANMNSATPAGIMAKASSLVSKYYSFNELLTEEARDAVKSNMIHIHDFDYYATRSWTCVQHDMKKLFKTSNEQTRPPKRIETACMLAVMSLEACQNEMHGGQAIPNFDYALAPFVKLALKEELALAGGEDSYIEYVTGSLTDYTKESAARFGSVAVKAVERVNFRVYQSLEAFIHNMNCIHSRQGNQVVFSSINYGTDDSPEGRCIIRNMLEATLAGVGPAHSTAIFPIQIFKMKKGVSSEPGDRNYDLLLKSAEASAKRYFPNFLNLDSTFNYDENWKYDDEDRYKHEVATMGCRTRTYGDIFGESTSCGRGNLSFTTLNLPGMALESRGDVDMFFTLLDKYAKVAVEQLRARYMWQKRATRESFPHLMAGVWQGSEDRAKSMEELIKHGTLAIGFIGLAEALTSLTGAHHGESEEAQKLGLKIVSHIKSIADKAALEHNLNYGVLATPAEGLSGKFTKKDREKYGIVAGVTDKDYYTNSSHVPVGFEISVTDKARIEGPYHELCLGGHIFYVEFDGAVENNPQSVIDLLDIVKKNNIGYASVNHSKMRCPKCGHETADTDVKTCPDCGSPMNVLQRITGYLVSTVDRWNHGKRCEYADRVKHA